MPIIIWTASARADLSAIIRYIAIRNPTAARRLRNAIDESVLPIREYPLLYRAGRVAGTREIVVHPNYIVIYRVRTDRIEIIAVVHARRRYP